MKRLLAHIQTVLFFAASVAFWSCSDKPDFIFLGEAEGRVENFNADVEVTPEKIRQLYQKYDVFEILHGDFYLIRSKQSYNNSRFLSRIIKMTEGKQSVAKTFYDCKIDTCHVLEFGNRLLLGLNSLQNNYYNPTSHKCKVLILKEDLSPISGEIFSSGKGHTYIKSLFICSDNTFICTLESAEVIGNPYGHYQYRFRSDFSITDSTSMVIGSELYNIVHSPIDFTKSDWGNDMSDMELIKMREDSGIVDSMTNSNSSEERDSTKRLVIEQKEVGIPVVKQSIPKDFVLVPAGRLKHLFYDYDSNCNSIYRDWDVDSFYICKFEVIQKEYVAVMGSNPSKYKGDSIPVHNISNYDAILFCQKKSIDEGYDGFYEIHDNVIKFKRNGNGYRLPTDHEWAFASRSGDTLTAYAAGDNLAEIAWYGRNSGNKPHRIALKKQNGRGLYDMNGNVSELSHTNKNEIWPKGGSYEEWPYDGHVFHEDDARGYAGGKFSNKKQDATAGIRLVFFPRGMEQPKDLKLYFNNL